MIDYTKLDISHIDRDHLLNHTQLRFKSEVDHNSGNMLFPYEAEYYEFKILVFKSTTLLCGSFHKFYNLKIKGKAQNYDDFTLSQFKLCVQMIEQDLNLNISESKIVNLEFGVNIPVNFNPSRFIELNVHGFNKTHFERLNDRCNGRGRYKRFENSLYWVKLYDKSRQFNLSESLLRVEVKTRKSRYLKELGIYILIDLFKEENLEVLKSNLLFRFNMVTILDNHLEEGTPEYWQLKKESSSRTGFRRKWLSFIEKMECSNQFTMRRYLGLQIVSKWDYLKSA